MQDWKILLTDGLEQIGQELLRRDCQVDNREGISAADLLDVIDQYEAIIVRGRTKVTAQVLQAGKKLVVIGRAGVGVDNIDLSVAAILTGFEFGIQPMIASGPDGKPSYAPYPLSIAVPAMALEHMMIFSIVEGMVTALILKYFVKHESDLVYATKEA